MTLPQKRIIRELLRLCVDHGFSTSYPLAPIAKKLGITEVLYDNNTSTGLLWDLGRHSKGYLDISQDGTHAGIDYDMAGMLENWSHPKSEPVG